MAYEEDWPWERRGRDSRRACWLWFWKKPLVNPLLRCSRETRVDMFMGQSSRGVGKGKRIAGVSKQMTSGRLVFAIAYFDKKKLF
jgi:hypothetical protein